MKIRTSFSINRAKCLQAKFFNMDSIKDLFTSKGEFLQSKHFSNIKRTIDQGKEKEQNQINSLNIGQKNKETRLERTIDKFNKTKEDWDAKEQTISNTIKRNTTSSSSLMRSQDLFRGKQAFLERVSSVT